MISTEILWGLIGIVITGSLPGWWGIYQNWHKYKQEGGEEEQATKIVNDAMEAMQKAVKLANDCQDLKDLMQVEVNERDLQVVSLTSEVTFLRSKINEKNCEIANLRLLLKRKHKRSKL